MRIGIVGASGLVGTELRALLEEMGHSWIGFSRSPEGREGEWRKLEDGFAGLDAVVNVAGESVAQRWTEENKKKFHASRVGVTRKVVDGLRSLPEGERPGVLVNASAVGYYGSRGEEELTEEKDAGDDYLARLCIEWEGAAKEAEALGVRVVCGRIGVVLGQGADAWKRMRIIFNLGAGGRLGSGKQFWPWVHIRDVVGGIAHALETGDVSGPLNLTGPNPVTNAEFTKVLGSALGRPAVLPVPPFALKIALGDFAEALLASYRVLPKKLEETGYQFRFSSLSEALLDLR
ncbi:MAG: TIGR01777 family oxidoreductase [Verrucomicrobiota bacterium JB023]|nr:TIGR01777 family oxidoreductase [Verrucomicrobiota bacterium JB023]